MRGTGDHYDALAASYDEHWIYGPEHPRRLAGRMAEALAPDRDDRLVDLGCGTGIYARLIGALVRPRHPLWCVDPSAAMLRQIDAPPPRGY